MRPGSERFEQRRYPVLDETAGVATAIVIYDGHVGLYLFKAQDETLQDVDIIGGAAATSSGW